MKNVCIVSAVGHYENATKYLSEKRLNDENHLIIFMYSNGVIPEKILTRETSHFWKKVHIFEPEKNATSGMNTVQLNESSEKFKKFIEERDLRNVDEVYLGVLPVLPMYNYIPSLYENSKINLIEDGTASYMLEDTKMFEHMVSPSYKSIANNKKQIKKKVNRKENGLMLLNTVNYHLFGSSWFARKQLNMKWNSKFHFNKIILSSPELIAETKNITYDEIEKFDYGSVIKKQEVQYDPDGLPIYFDQNFGVAVEDHVTILDKIFINRGIEEIIIKLHPKSRPNYIEEFLREDLETTFTLELGNFSGEDFLRQSCPNEIYGLNSTVLMNAKDIVKINFILNEYFDLMNQSEVERNYTKLMFMNYASYNLEKMISPGKEKLYKFKHSKLIQIGLKQPKEVQNEELTCEEEKSKYVKKLEKGVKNYMIGALRQEINEKQVMFEAYKGMYACSPKELYLYMKNNDQFRDYTFVWSRSLDMDIDSQLELSKDPRTKLVNYAKPEYFDELAKSKLIITNQRLHNKFAKKENQYVLQTWHGTPFKKDAMSITVSSHNVNNDRRVEVNHHDVKNYDYFLVQNEFSAVELVNTFMLEDYPEVQVLKSGYPRNSSLVDEISKEKIDSIKEKYNIPKDKKVLFYTPTWRDHHKKNKAGINDIFDFEKWQEELSDEWIILFRGHYFHAKAVDLEQYKGFIYDTTSYNDINEFYLIADLLVTDYSSSFFDFLNLKRPILFYMPDFIAYIKLSRKLHFEPETELPGPVSYSVEEFLKQVKDYKTVTDQYMSNYDNYLNQFCPWDQNASQNVIDVLKEQNVLK